MKFNCFILVMTLCLSIHNAVFPQNKQTDSLLLVLKNAKEDSNKVKTLEALCNNLRFNGDFKKQMQYAEDALSLSEKINFKKGKGTAYTCIGRVYGGLGNTSEALKNFYKALEIHEEIGDKPGIAVSFQMIGDEYLSEGDTSEALKNYHAAFKINDEIGDKIHIASNYMSIGNVYFVQGNNLLALEKYFTALKIYEEIGGLAPYWAFNYSYNSIGIVYERQGELIDEMGNIPSSKISYLQALIFYQKAFNIAKKMEKKDFLTASYYYMGSIQSRLQKYSSARNYFEKSLLLALSVSHKSYIILNYLRLSQLDAIAGNYEQAYRNYREYIIYRDSVADQQNGKKISQIKMLYEFEKKESAAKAEQEKKDVLTNTEIRKQRVIRNFSFAGVALILLFSIYGFYRYRRHKKMQNQQALMNERLRISSELHDEVGATLSGIAMYSHLTKEQMKKGQTNEIEKSLNIMQQSSAQMVDKLSDIVWLINPEQDSLQKLVTRLEEYATDMAAIKNMHVKINVPEKIAEINLPVESRRNIYLFCKEAINNAVKYSNATMLELTVKEVDGKLEFCVSDNGKGFDAVMVRRGNGLENMQKRADEIGAKLLLQSKENGGASVSLQCKIT